RVDTRPRRAAAPCQCASALRKVVATAARRWRCDRRWAYAERVIRGADTVPHAPGRGEGTRGRATRAVLRPVRRRLPPADGRLVPDRAPAGCGPGPPHRARVGGPGARGAGLLLWHRHAGSGPGRTRLCGP